MAQVKHTGVSEYDDLVNCAWSHRLTFPLDCYSTT